MRQQQRLELGGRHLTLVLDQLGLLQAIHHEQMPSVGMADVAGVQPALAIDGLRRRDLQAG
ncbi:MAG: hypothetical protein U1E76_05940 [Planctomycetota bacterium]